MPKSSAATCTLRHCFQTAACKQLAQQENRCTLGKQKCVIFQNESQRTRLNNVWMTEMLLFQQARKLKRKWRLTIIFKQKKPQTPKHLSPVVPQSICLRSTSLGSRNTGQPVWEGKKKKSLLINHMSEVLFPTSAVSEKDHGLLSAAKILKMTNCLPNGRSPKLINKHTKREIKSPVAY